ncbi:MAG: 4-hydroxy-3-methylbut-2-enyl diphosphate reductase [Candidatus Tritonobacter lacicola]|nr:4-hydroxy-3-methylbut-2-enyl diphosphate reductase [Candidatus Tritonobacter lacicola]
MKIRVARTVGFCMGVKRALFRTLSLARKRTGKLYTWGPLIHNPQIIEVLSERGVEVLKELPPRIDGTVIIRAHGVAPAVRAELKRRATRVCDATCPDVMKVQSIVKKHARRGFSIVIVGDRGHAEVEGLMGFAGDRCSVINSTDEARRLPGMEKVCVVAQTTQDTRLYGEICSELKRNSPDCRVFQTICRSTRDKQEELRELAKSVDAVIVVGGKGSANTRRLADIARSCGARTFHVESESGIDGDEICSFDRIGIASGSSTPNWMIFRVVDRLEEVGRKKTSPVVRWVREAFRFAVTSNIYVAAGAGFLACAASLIMGIQPTALCVTGSALYVLGIHILNHFTEREALQFSEPAMMKFYERKRFLLVPMGAVGVCAVLAIGAFRGLLPFVFLGVACLLGIAYSITVIPVWRDGRISLGRIRDIPASKDLFVPAAWTAVIILLARGRGVASFNASVLVAAAFVFGLVFIRCLLFSMRDVQGDMIVGRETIPTLLGRERGRNIAVAAVFVLAAVLLGAMPYIGLLALFLLLPLAYILCCIYAYYSGERRIPHGVLFEVVLDTSFVIAGASALSWKAVFTGAAM